MCWTPANFSLMSVSLVILRAALRVAWCWPSIRMDLKTPRESDSCQSGVKRGGGEEARSPGRRGERAAAAPGAFAGGGRHGSRAGPAVVLCVAPAAAVRNSAAGPPPLPALECFSSAGATRRYFRAGCRQRHTVSRNVFLEVFKIHRFRL